MSDVSSPATKRIDLSGQVALVTGASSGLGQAAAIALGRSGARVVVNHPPTENSRRRALMTVAEIEKHGGEGIAVPADVSDEKQVDAMFGQAVERFGTLHLVVANAGIERPSPVHEMSLDDWKTVIGVNLTGAFLTARGAVREFLRRGPQHEISPALGKIVFTSSVHEIIPWAFQVNYAASKGGVAMLMRSMAQELAPKRIRINSVAPGAIKTPINKDAWFTDEARTELLKLIPYGRVGEPDDIARAILWLLSDESDYVNGTTLIVDGGMTLYPSFNGNG
jgi:glucose 1-dehydrogenase